MRRYINEGHDIKSASDMKAAIDSYGGVKGYQAAVVKVQESKQTMTNHTMSGIQSINNFSFESGSLRVRKAYNAGPGKRFTPTQVKRFGNPQGPTDLCVEQPFKVPREEVGAFRSTTQDSQQPQPSTSGQTVEEEPPAEEASKVYFSFPEEGCTKTYQSFMSLQKHLDVGKHLVRLERETTYDTITRKWAETCQEVSGSYLNTEARSGSQTAVTTSSTSPVLKGWALKTSRKAIRFSEKVKTHLKRIFLEGEETGRKASAVDIDVCSKLRTLRDESGKKVFNKEDWLTAEQIARYFSRLSVMHRSGRLAIDQADPSPTEEEEEDFVAEAEEIATRFRVRRQLEL